MAMLTSRSNPSRALYSHAIQPFLPPFHAPPSVSRPAPPPKGFMDRLAEALLGGDVENSPASKYALICQRCFAHNGLVMKEEMMDIREWADSLFLRDPRV